MARTRQRAAAAIVAHYAIALLTAASGHAESDWKNQFSGLDGVAVTCVSSFASKRAEQICEEMSAHVKARAEKAGATAVASGYFLEGDTSPPKPEGMAKPLDVVIFIRGSEDPPGLFIGTRASVTYTAAVEAGSGEKGRSGDLVIYERTTLGTGPLKRLQPAIAGAAKDRLEPLMVLMDEYWPKEGESRP